MISNGAIPIAAVQLPIFDISNPTPEEGRSMITVAANYGFLYIDTKGTDFTEAIVDRVFETVFASDEVIIVPADQSALVQKFLLLTRRREGGMSHWARCAFLLTLITISLSLSISTYQNMGWTGMHGELLDPANQKVSR